MERERAQQAAWRARNPEYQHGRRLDALKGKEDTDPPVHRRPLDRLPWEFAQMQFGIQGAEFLGQFGRLLVGHAQMQMKVQVHDSS